MKRQFALEDTTEPKQLMSYESDLNRFGPLLEMQEVVFLLSDGSGNVNRLVDAGRLRACNIGLGTKQRLLRIWKYSLARLLAGEDMPAPAFDALLPHSRSTFLLRELAAFFACTEMHVRNLADLGEFQKEERVRNLADIGNSRTTDGTLRFTRQSVIQFLERRAVIR